MVYTIIWLLLTLFTWLALLIKSKCKDVHHAIIAILLGGFVRLIQIFLISLIEVFVGVSILSYIFGFLVSGILTLSLFLLPLLFAGRVNVKKLSGWLYFLFGFFLTGFVTSFFISILF
jgi:hypothetical protein